jgi:hypothetical protein
MECAGKINNNSINIKMGIIYLIVVDGCSKWPIAIAIPTNRFPIPFDE